MVGWLHAYEQLQAPGFKDHWPASDLRGCHFRPADALGVDRQRTSPSEGAGAGFPVLVSVRFGSGGSGVVLAMVHLAAIHEASRPEDLFFSMPRDSYHCLVFCRHGRIPEQGLQTWILRRSPNNRAGVDAGWPVVLALERAWPGTTQRGRAECMRNV